MVELGVKGWRAPTPALTPGNVKAQHYDIFWTKDEIFGKGATAPHEDDAPVHSARIVQICVSEWEQCKTS